MKKMNLHSPHIVNQNIEQIEQLFPNCVTETAEGRKIDFDTLRQELSADIVEGTKERYRLDWPGKREAIAISNIPTTSTLRPAREESVDFDNTENIYIEGDNLEVLKILQESYLNKIKMIYIDPPYNTGKDFVYRDDFAADVEEWRESEERDEEGRRLVVNPETAGRYHSDWLSMMYPRLKLARNLLTEDGVIFISIDDNEVHNLRKVCDEIFGEEKFAGLFPWRKRTAKSDVPFGVSQDYEWLLCYAKSSNFRAGLEGGTRKYYETKDLPNKPWRIHDLTTQRSSKERPNSNYTMINPKTGDKYPVNPKRTWAVTMETFDRYYTENRIVFPGDYDFLNISRPAFRYFKEDDIKKAGKYFGYIPISTKLPEDVGMSQDGTKDFDILFNSRLFSYPKPVNLIKHLVNASTNISNEGVILDFFAGSSTTAHAVMQLNAEDGGNRKYIMVQLPEETDESSEAYQAGYKNISEIGKERIRRAAAQIKTEQEEKTKTETEDLFAQKEDRADNNKLDLGFRVYKLDSSNMKDVYYNPTSYDQEQLDIFADNIKADRTDEDLVTQVILDWGLELSLPIEQKEISGKKVYAVNDNFLYCCFDRDVEEGFAREVATHNPIRIVFRDNSFANDTAKENVKQLLNQLIPDTQMRVI